jgi:hypothetical protein
MNAAHEATRLRGHDERGLAHDVDMTIRGASNRESAQRIASKEKRP